MTDQRAGEFFTHLMGLDDALPQERVRNVLYKTNFDPEQGMYNATYPPGRQPRMSTLQNVQAEGNWTGIEYNSATMLMDQGMPREGMEVVKAVYRCYMRVGSFFNHEECGPHYADPCQCGPLCLRQSATRPMPREAY